MKTPTVIVLIVLVVSALASISAAPPVGTFTEDFNDPALPYWKSTPTSPSSSLTVSDSLLTMSNYSLYTKPTWKHGIVAFNLSVDSDTEFAAWGFIDPSSLSPPVGICFIYMRPSLLAMTYNGSGSPTVFLIRSPLDESFHRYAIKWDWETNWSEKADISLDGIHLLTINTSIPQAAMPIRIFNVNSPRLTCDWVSLLEGTSLFTTATSTTTKTSTITASTTQTSTASSTVTQTLTTTQTATTTKINSTTTTVVVSTVPTTVTQAVTEYSTANTVLVTSTYTYLSGTTIPTTVTSTYTSTATSTTTSTTVKTNTTTQTVTTASYSYSTTITEALTEYLTRTTFNYTTVTLQLTSTPVVTATKLIQLGYSGTSLATAVLIAILISAPATMMIYRYAEGKPPVPFEEAKSLLAKIRRKRRYTPEELIATPEETAEQEEKPDTSNHVAENTGENESKSESEVKDKPVENSREGLKGGEMDWLFKTNHGTD